MKQTENNAKPRLSIDLNIEQYRKLNKYIPWGLKGTIFSIIIDDFIKACEEYGQDIVVAGIVRKAISLKNITPEIKPSDNNKKKKKKKKKVNKRKVVKK